MAVPSTDRAHDQAKDTIDTSMRLLVDTNILIPLEPTVPEGAEPTTAVAAELVGLAQGAHLILVHPKSLAELASDPDARRRHLRRVLLRKYAGLTYPPVPTAEMEARIGRAAKGTNDWVDDHLLAAVYRDAVDLLVTQDEGIHRKAKRLGIEDRVVRLRDAVEALRNLVGAAPAPPPFVAPLPAHGLDETDPIFASFRRDYGPEFDAWLRRAKRQGRRAWVISVPGSTHYAGVCIVKEHDDEYALGGRVLKISSLKVSDDHRGNRYGELLLKTVFNFCTASRFDAVWVTVFDHHAALISLLRDFGFEDKGVRTRRGELVLAKRLTWDETVRQALDPLDFHVRFGPPAVKLMPSQVFLVPIMPKYHELLFPEGEDRHNPLPRQLELFAQEPRPFGNALRKAYLCHAPTRRLQSGSCLLFYRSRDIRAVTFVGVVESVHVSSDAADVARFAGQRTVYSYEEIERMCSSPVLAIRFRQDRLLAPPIHIGELVDAGVVRRAPQSITVVPAEKTSWIADRIGA